MSESQPPKVIHIGFESDDDSIFPIATNLLINFDRDHFYIRIYQTRPPATLDGELPDVVKAKLISGFAVSPSRLKDMVRAIQENIERHDELSADGIDLGVDELEGVDQDDE